MTTSTPPNVRQGAVSGLDHTPLTGDDQSEVNPPAEEVPADFLASGETHPAVADIDPEASTDDSGAVVSEETAETKQDDSADEEPTNPAPSGDSNPPVPDGGDSGSEPQADGSENPEGAATVEAQEGENTSGDGTGGDPADTGDGQAAPSA